MSQAIPLTGNWIRRHPVLTVCLLAYAFTWIIIFPQLITLLGVASIPVPGFVAIAVGTYGCLWAALIVEGATRGRAGIRGLLSRLVRWRVGLQWYLMALCFPPAYLLAGIGLHVLLGGVMPLLPVMTVVPERVLPAILLLFAQFILLNTEEFTWRGVVLPRLQTTRSALSATLILAVVEGLWHLPYFWVPNSIEQQLGPAGFLVWNIALAVVFTWVYNNARGSLLIAILFHASGNVFSALLGTPGEVRPLFLSVGVLCVIAVVLVAVFGPVHLSRKPEAELTEAIEPN